MRKNTILKFAFLLAALALKPAFADTHYVRADGLDTNDGLSWNTAGKSVKAAITAASSGDQIWVAQGVYLENLTMKDGVSLYGGFAGAETQLSDRPAFPRADVDPNETVLDGQQKASVVYFGPGIGLSTILDGFTIKNGKGTFFASGELFPGWAPSSYSSGGGILCDTGSPTISHNKISGNTGGLGGGIHLQNSNAQVLDNIITANSGSYNYGAGLSIKGGAPVISRNTISKNTGTTGTVVMFNSSATVSSNTVSENAVSSDGGGIAAFFSRATITANTIAKNNGGLYGGGIDLGLEGDYHVEANIVEGNTAKQGGGIYINGQTSVGQLKVNLVNNIISDNTVTDSGGGVYTTYSSPTLTGNTISGNKATKWSGGIYIKNTLANSLTSISGNKIADNRAETYDGGGVYFAPSTNGNMSNNEISGNYAKQYGGGVRIDSSSFVGAIENNRIHHNTGQMGGGVYINASAQVCRNEIYSNDGYLAGGIFTWSTDKSIFHDNIIHGNTATSNYTVFVSGLNKFINNTIVANKTKTAVGVNGTATLTFANNIVAENLRGLSVVSSAKFSAANNCFFGNSTADYVGTKAAAGDIYLDPQFVDSANGDYHLKMGSPCINTGKNADVTPDMLDFDGNTRIFPELGNVDMGAYEYVAHPIWTALDAKRLVPDGTEVCLFPGALITTAKLDSLGAFYMEKGDRSFGIQCRSSELLAVGQSGIVRGTMATIDGERVITGASILPDTLASAAVPKPLSLIGRILGGGECGLQQAVYSSKKLPRTTEEKLLPAAGLNNVGLLVTLNGKVTQIDPAGKYFYVNDGSMLKDGTETSGEANVGVRIATDGTSYRPGQMLIIKGVSSCFINSEGKALRLVRVADPGHIRQPANE